MIGSFWNLCRACPSMPVDKLHSEYRSTYRWHEYTGPRQEVVRRPPQANAPNATGEKLIDVQHNSTRNHDEDTHSELPKLEPALPRRKKYPDLAYRHHEFLINDGVPNNKPTENGGIGYSDSRTRSEERDDPHWKPSRRSKSEGPARCGDGVREGKRRRDSDPDVDNMGKEEGLLRKAISKISTEYRRQFAWPQGHLSRRDAAGSTPRKSKSMGALKPNANAMVHKKRIDLENKNASELEPLVDDRTNNEDRSHLYKEELNTEYKKKFRPFSQYEYSKGRFTSKVGGNVDKTDDSGPKSIPINCERSGDSWYQEVVELRKKAGEYRNRGWASEQIGNEGNDKMSDMYNKQMELWDQVSRRSSLSALSLASMSHKNYTKEEKEEDNNKKSSPSKANRNAENSRMVREMFRHHLERTIGGPDFDGLILSPTRDKLEPTIPRKDDDSRGSQKNSPKKNSPMKSSSLKRNNQKSAKGCPRNARSQSVGPTDTGGEKRSPKRQSRSATVKERKTTGNTTTTTTKRPRPSSLNTTASSRSKYSSVPSKKEDDRLAKPNTKQSYNDSKQKLVSLHKGFNEADRVKTDSNTTTPRNAEELEKEQNHDSINYEPVIKSPPEPTRVKSPEQILMRSPDPVNWTVPLDTGKTFTVTQNVREGDISSRPHSEVKAWTPPDVPPPVAQSAPPTLTEQNKEQGMDLAVKV